MRNLFALLSAALLFWVFHIGFIFLSMMFESGYEYRQYVDVVSVFLAGLAAGVLGTIVSRTKSTLLLAGILLLISLPAALTIILIPDGKPESVTSLVLICAVGAYACVRGFQHDWYVTLDEKSE